MNTVVVYLDLQSSYKRRKTAKYSCHKVWGLSVVKQLNEKENKMFSKLTQFLRSIVLQEILPTFCGSSILQLFFFCNLSEHPSRLLLCSWLKKRIDIQYKHFNPHPDWSRRKSCNQNAWCWICRINQANLYLHVVQPVTDPILLYPLGYYKDLVLRT